MNITVPVDQYREITCLANTALWALGFLEGIDTEHCSGLDLRHTLRAVRARLADAAGAASSAGASSSDCHCHCHCQLPTANCPRP